MSNLRPCAACARHVRLGAPSCPFCGAAVVAGPPLTALRYGRRIARATVAAVGLAASPLVACDTTSDPNGADQGVARGTDQGVSDRGFIAGDAYGAPPDADAQPGHDHAVAGDAYGAPPDAELALDQGPVAGDAYGAPPDAEPALDQGSVAGDAYGAPPDAEPAIDQGFVAGDAYGAPPDAS